MNVGSSAEAWRRQRQMYDIVRASAAAEAADQRAQTAERHVAALERRIEELEQRLADLSVEERP